MWVDLEDGRTIGVPLAWFPRLLHGAASLRSEVTISPSGLHWEELDEDISIAGLLAGRGDQTRARSNSPLPIRPPAIRPDPGEGREAVVDGRLIAQV